MTNNFVSEINLTQIGKRFNRDWIFRHVDANFIAGKKYAITGSNGSGKSTLLQLIAGLIIPNEGTLQFNGSEKAIPIQNVYEHVSIAAPYLELLEEMTPIELLQFHAKFKPLLKPINSILEEVELNNAGGKEIRNFSSGMKQRLKLAQAFFSKTAVLLLDEPTTNLDLQGINLYHRLIEQYTQNRIVIISSNDAQEYRDCSEVIKMEIYK